MRVGGRCWRGDGVGVDLSTGLPVPAVDLVRGLLDHVRPALVRTGELDEVTGLLDEVVAHGNGATRQRRALRRAGDVGDVVAQVSQHTLRDRWPTNAA
jgi:glutamate---cysteine ligase / carboxylate-amine ligase